MKVIQINTVYNTGSTGKITAAIYNLSNESGYEALVAYGRGKTPSENNVNGMLVGNKSDFLFHVLVNFTTGKNGFASKAVTKKMLAWMDKEKPDIIHLHNIHGFYIHVGMLFEYIKQHNIPVIWTLHDCWSFTGGCAFFDYAECSKWETGCYDCPIFRSDYPYSIFKDNTKNNYLAKRDAFTGVKNMTIVTPCNWLKNYVQKSFLKEYPVEVIYNGINLDVFKPVREYTSANILSMANDTKVLLGVASIWEKRKGLDYMLKLSEDFNLSNGYQVVLIGLNKKQCSSINKKYGDKIITIERTNNQNELAEWYSRAYAYINPTLQDNFPTTNIEALACGTPVITFNTGGSPESFEGTKYCGHTVAHNDITGLIDAINNMPSIQDISAECAELSPQLDKNKSFQKYIDLYDSILGQING